MSDKILHNNKKAIYDRIKYNLKILKSQTITKPSIERNIYDI